MKIAFRLLFIFEVILALVVLGLWIVARDNFQLCFFATLFWAVLFSMTFGFYWKRNIKREFKGRPGWRKKLELGLVVFLTFSILGLVNFIAVKKDFYLDFTKEKKYSLAEQTVKILGQFEKPLTVKAFISPKDRSMAQSFLRLFQFVKKDIQIEYLDPDVQLAEVKKYGINEYGMLVWEYGDRMAIARQMQERDIANALLKLSRDRSIRIFYTLGHGEVDFKNENNPGASIVFNLLKGQGYELESIDFSLVHDIPSHVDLLMVLGPQNDFLEHEIKLLQHYLKEKGDLLVALSPQVQTGKELPRLRSFLKGKGIVFNKDIVLDRLSSIHNMDPTISVIDKFPTPHDIFENFSGRILFPFSSSLGSVEINKTGMRMTPLLLSSLFPASWGETNFSSLFENKVSYDEKVDGKGPLTLLAAYEEVAPDEQKKRQRFVALGSSSFFINAYATHAPNANLFLNIASWLVEDQKIISLNRPGAQSERLFVSSYQLSLIFYITVLFFPLILCGAALVLYWKRRRM